MGFPIETCLPDRCASLIASEMSASSSKRMFVRMFRYFRWYRKIGTSLPSQEISSMFGSFISGSSRDQPMKLRIKK